MIPHPLCTGYSIILTPTASKDLSKLGKADVTAIIAKIHELVSGSCNLDIKKLLRYISSQLGIAKIYTSV